MTRREEIRRGVLAQIRDDGGVWDRARAFAYGHAHGQRDTLAALRELQRKGRVRHLREPERWELVTTRRRSCSAN